MDRPERDLGRNPEPEGQQQDRIKRDLRDRIDRNQHGLEDVARKPAEPERQTDRKPPADRERERHSERLAGLRGMNPERVLPDELHAIAERFRRRTHRDIARDKIERLPGDEHKDAERDKIDCARKSPGHRSPRFCINRFSHCASPVLSAIETSRINRISGYIVALSKLLKAKLIS